MFSLVVLERLTSPMQPLDVGLKRGFQSSYASKFDANIAKALDDLAIHYSG